MVEEFMLNGYIGIVSRRGLCRIEVERHDSLRRAQSNVAGNTTQPGIAFWAVLPSHVARDISALVAEGESREALRLLNQTAREGGHLFSLNQ